MHCSVWSFTCTWPASDRDLNLSIWFIEIYHQLTQKIIIESENAKVHKINRKCCSYFTINTKATLQYFCLQCHMPLELSQLSSRHSSIHIQVDGFQKETVLCIKHFNF